MIKEFDTMFPRCLYVAKGTNFKELTDTFNLYLPESENIILPDEKWINDNVFKDHITATVFLAERKSDKRVGYIVILNDDEVNIGICAHEASHILTYFETYFGLDRSSQEYRAYMTQWFTMRILDVWNIKETENIQ